MQLKEVFLDTSPVVFYTVEGIATASTPIDAGPVKAELLEI